MALNGSELLDKPIETIMSPYTDLLGGAFWLVPVSVIAAALFVKTRSITMVGAWLLGCGMLLSTAGIFAGFPGVLDFYLAVVVMGVISIIVGIVLEQKGG